MLFDRIILLCREHNMTVYALEKATGIKKGTIQKWKVAVPMTNNLILVADYFSVSLDYLLCRTNYAQSHKDPGIYYSALLEISKICKCTQDDITGASDSIHKSESD